MKKHMDEGFAYYTPRSHTMHVNPRMRRLKIDDWYIIILHELIGHHLHPYQKTRANAERCAMACEANWAKFFGVEEAAARWYRYRKARAQLDRSINHTEKLSRENYAIAKQIFSSIPVRMVNLRVELLRVMNMPGSLKEYVIGPKGPQCGC